MSTRTPYLQLNPSVTCLLLLGRRVVFRSSLIDETLSPQNLQQWLGGNNGRVLQICFAR